MANRRKKKAISTLVGGVLFLLILTTSFTAIFATFSSYESYQRNLREMNEFDLQRQRERLMLKDVFFGNLTQYSPGSVTILTGSGPTAPISNLAAQDSVYTGFGSSASFVQVLPVRNMNFTADPLGWHTSFPPGASAAPLLSYDGSVGNTQPGGSGPGSIFSDIAGNPPPSGDLQWASYFTLSSAPTSWSLSWASRTTVFTNMDPITISVRLINSAGTSADIASRTTSGVESLWSYTTGVSFSVPAGFWINGVYRLTIAFNGTRAGVGFAEAKILFDDVGVLLNMQAIRLVDWYGSFAISNAISSLNQFNVYYTGHYLSTGGTSTYNPTSVTMLPQPTPTTRLISGSAADLAVKDGVYMVVASGSKEYPPSGGDVLPTTISIAGSYINLASKDASYWQLRSYGSATTTTSNFPTSTNSIVGSLVSGSVADLTANDQSYMIFASTPSGAALSSDGSVSGSFNAASGSVSLTTANSNDVIYVVVSIRTTSSQTVSSVSGAGLTWNFRSARNSGTSAVRVEAWYAIASSPLSAASITVTLSAAAKFTLVAFGISGANTASPFDPNVSIPASADGNSATPSTTITTSNSNDFIIGALAAQGTVTATPGSGFTVIATPSTSTTIGFIGASSGNSPGSIALRAASSANNAGGATSLTISTPAGVLAGDVMIAQVTVRGGTGTTITPPAGWTKIRSDNSTTTLQQAAYYRVAGSSESASYAWSFGASSLKASGGIAAYIGVDNTTPVNAHGGQANAASTSITAPSITTTVANAMLVGFFGTATGTSVSPPTGMTENWDISSTAGAAGTRTTSEGTEELLGAAGGTGTRSATSAGSAVNIGQLIALAPVAPTLTVSKPTGVAAGHVMIAQVTARGGTGTTITASSGWTLIQRDDSGTTLAQAAYYKVATSSEPASYTWTFNTPQQASGGIVAYSGVDNTNPINANGGQPNPSSTSITAPSITTTVADTMLMGLFGTAVSTTVTPPTGMTERWDIASSGSAATRITSEGADESFAGPGGTGTRVATASAAAVNIGQLLALAPDNPANVRGAAEYQIVSTSQTNLAVGFTLGASSEWAIIADAVVAASAHKTSTEFAGSSNTFTWTQLEWIVDSSWTIAGVSASIQIFNSAANSYPTSGDGYMTYTSGVANTDELKSAIISANPTNFRDASGSWKILVNGTSTSSSFNFRADLVEYRPTHYNQFTTDWYGSFTIGETAATLTQLKIDYTGRYSSTGVSQNIYIWNFTTSSWTGPIGAADTVGTTDFDIPTRTIGSGFANFVDGTGGVRVRVAGVLSTTSSFDVFADYLHLTTIFSNQGTDWYSSFTITQDAASITQMGIDYTGRYSLGGVSQSIYLWNFTTSSWTGPIGSVDIVGTTDFDIAPRTINSGFANFVGPSGEVRIRVRGDISSSSEVRASADFMRLTVDASGGGGPVSISQTLWIYNFNAASWDKLHETSVGSNDASTGAINVTSSLSNYVSSGQVRVRVRGDATSGFSANADYLSLEVFAKDQNRITIRISNTGSEILRVVSLWVVKGSTLDHFDTTLSGPRYLDSYFTGAATGFISPGETRTLRLSPYSWTAGQYTFRVVTERGNTMSLTADGG